MFDPSCALTLGVEKAILLHNMMFWISKNSANKRHLYEGRYWMYNTADAFHSMHPYWHSRKISRMLYQLEEDGWIISGNYNGTNYDRTKWYAITDKTNCQNWLVQMTDLSNRLVESVRPIPDEYHIKPNNTPLPPVGDSAVAEEVEEAVGEKASTPKQSLQPKKEGGSSRFTPPSAEEVGVYVAERVALGKPRVDADNFVDFYEAKGWKIGNNKMKSWKACARTWERNSNNGSSGGKQSGTTGLVV